MNGNILNDNIKKTFNLHYEYIMNGNIMNDNIKYF